MPRLDFFPRVGRHRAPWLVLGIALRPGSPLAARRCPLRVERRLPCHYRPDSCSAPGDVAVNQALKTQIGDVALLDGRCGSATATAAPVTIHLLPPLRRSEGGRLSTGRKGRHCQPRGDQTKRKVPHVLPHFA